MKLQNIQLNKIENAKNDNTKLPVINSMIAHNSDSKIKSYPSNYYLSFGTRSIKEVYDICADTYMPSTVKTLIDDLALTTSEEKFETLISQPRLYQLQKLAFKDLNDCHSVDDIKNAYPSEKCFKDIKSIDEVSPEGEGVFNYIAAKSQDGKKVFDMEEDVCVFVAKQIFYEGTSITDIKNTLSSLAIDEDVKNKIKNSHNWGAKVFKPLGITVPDGRKYGSAILYSEDRKYATALSEALSDNWKTLSAEEVTKRISKLLQGGKKEQLTMIDAWNKCISLRKELSEFLFENISNSEYVFEEDSILTCMYDGNFPIKMRKLMSDFWADHPQRKEELSAEIKKSRKLYDEKMAEGEEAFAAYEREIKEKRNLIKQKLIEEKEKNHSFDSAKGLIKKIAQQSKKIYIRTPETINDFYNILLQHISNRQLKIYEESLIFGNNMDEFNKAYPPYREIENAKNSLEYFNLLAAQIVTILAPDLKRGKINEDEVCALIQDDAKLDSLIRTLVKNRTPLELAEYSKAKKLMSQREKEQVRYTLTEFVSQDADTLKALDELIDTQGKYLRQVNSDNKSIKHVTTLLILQKLDMMCDTKYAKNYAKQVQNEKLQQRKLDLLDTIDWNSFKTSSWNL